MCFGSGALAVASRVTLDPTSTSRPAGPLFNESQVAQLNGVVSTITFPASIPGAPHCTAIRTSVVVWAVTSKAALEPEQLVPPCPDAVTSITNPASAGTFPSSKDGESL